MNKHKAETLVRTGPGTAMGNLLRRYWVPALLSLEIEAPDGPQVRVQILGEKLLAFRDTDGQVGLIDEFCSHRGVSLYFGRNEENGIRCAYHGLKFSRYGECVDVPSAPQVCPKMGIKAYPCMERAGIVWAYMGPGEMKPAPPEVEWCTLPASHVFVSKRLQECNYLQAMEGGIDTSHVSYVHRFEVDEDPMHRGTKANEYIKADGNVIFQIERSDFGLTLYGRRNGEQILLLAHHPVAVSLVHAHTAVRGPRTRRPCLGTDRRRTLLGVEHQFPSAQAAVCAGARSYGAR